MRKKSKNPDATEHFSVAGDRMPGKAEKGVSGTGETISGLDIFCLSAAIVSFTFVALTRINADFFYDEVYTLANYIFVPFQNTVWIYLDANNHFLSNLINSIVVKTWHIPDLFTLFDSPWKIRIVELLYASGAVYFLWRMKEIFGVGIARYAVLLLVTCIPFLNYATLVRGYCLNVFLMSALMYFVFAQGRNRKFGVMVTTGLLLYSMPSNIYVVTAIIIGFLLTGRYRDVLWIVFGVCFAGVAYLPLVQGLMSDTYLKAAYHFFNPTLLRIFPGALHSFVSWRYLLLIPVVIGLIQAKKRWSREATFLTSILIIPFFLAWAKGGGHYERSFLVQLPAFCILAAIGLGGMKWPARLKRWAYPAIASYCVATMIISVAFYSHVLKNDILEGNPRRISILCNYWDAYFHPNATLKEFASSRSNSVVLVRVNSDRAALSQYTAKYRFPGAVPENRDSLYVISCEVPPGFILGQEGVAVERVNKNLDFHNIYLIRRTYGSSAIEPLSYLNRLK